MPTFQDTAGREWPIQLHVDAVRRVRAECGLDLLAIDKPDVIEQLTDPCRLVEVLWVLVAEQAARDGITPEQFGRSLGGAAIEQATDALLEALCDFFPPRRAALLRTLMDRLRRVNSLQLDQAEAELAGMTDAKLQRLIDRQQKQIRGG